MYLFRAVTQLCWVWKVTTAVSSPIACMNECVRTCMYFFSGSLVYASKILFLQCHVIFELYVFLGYMLYLYRARLCGGQLLDYGRDLRLLWPGLNRNIRARVYSIHSIKSHQIFMREYQRFMKAGFASSHKPARGTLVPLQWYQHSPSGFMRAGDASPHKSLLLPRKNLARFYTMYTIYACVYIPIKPRPQ